MRTTLLIIGFYFVVPLGWSEAVSIRFVDKSTGSLTPVRVELLDANLEPVVAVNSIPITSDCALAPLPGWLSQPAKNSLANPFHGTVQHYVDGVGRYDLDPGRYRLRAFKGTQFKTPELDFVVSEGSNQFVVVMERWYTSPRQKWFSTDVHLHIGRTPNDNQHVLRWMEAEDLAIANLLQMGALTHFAAAQQRPFESVNGPGSLLLPGQEHPRTHLLGHSLGLGGSRPVDERASYIQYDKTFKQVRQAGGISGFAHWGAGPAKDGIALNVTGGNVEILEVLSVGALYVDTWYELLNLGFQIAAVAGTDFPCLAGVPGRERTYLRMEEPLSREGMVTALRKGWTMVTNGPMLSFSLEGKDIGSQLELPALKNLRVQGELQFDPSRDSMTALELVHNGNIVRAWDVRSLPGQFSFDEIISLRGSGWIALRAKGHKLGETLTRSYPAWMSVGFTKWMSGGTSDEVGDITKAGGVRQSYAHTSPIYVRAPGVSSPGGDPSSILLRLNKLEQMLVQQKYPQIWDWLPYSDGVGADHLTENTTELLKQLREARKNLLKRTGSG